MYPPLVLAAFEARYTGATELMHGESLKKVLGGLRGIFPIFSDSTDSGFDTPVSNASGVSSFIAQFSAEDRTSICTLGRESIILETSNCRTYDNFRKMIEGVLTVLAETGGIERLLRVGLRYLDEIQLVEPPSEPDGWNKVVSEGLLAPLRTVVSLAPRRLSCRMSFDLGDFHRVEFKYAALPRPAFRVSPAKLQMRARHIPGPVFTLDIDSYWANSSSLDVKKTLELCDRLLLPITDLLKASIHEPFQDEVLPGGTTDVKI